MKKLLLSAILLSTLGMSSVNAATVGSSVDVSATVEKVCYFRTLRNVHFDYDATVNQDLTQQLESEEMFSIQCSKGLNSYLMISGANNENRFLTAENGDKLKYILNFQDSAGNDLFVNSSDALTYLNGYSVLSDGNSFYFNFKMHKGQFVKAQNYSETITLSVSY